MYETEHQILRSMGIEPDTLTNEQLDFALKEIWHYQSVGGFLDEIATRIAIYIDKSLP